MKKSSFIALIQLFFIIIPFFTGAVASAELKKGDSVLLATKSGSSHSSLLGVDILQGKVLRVLDQERVEVEWRFSSNGLMFSPLAHRFRDIRLESELDKNKIKIVQFWVPNKHNSNDTRLGRMAQEFSDHTHVKIQPFDEAAVLDLVYGVGYIAQKTEISAVEDDNSSSSCSIQ